MRIARAFPIVLGFLLGGCSPVASTFLGAAGDPQLASSGTPKLLREAPTSPAVAAALTAPSDETGPDAERLAHECSDHTFFGPVVTKCAWGGE